MVAKDGIEPPTQGFSTRNVIFVANKISHFAALADSNPISIDGKPMSLEECDDTVSARRIEETRGICETAVLHPFSIGNRRIRTDLSVMVTIAPSATAD